MSTTLDIGLTQEELREQVVSRAADRLVEAFVDDGEVRSSLTSMIRDALDEAVERIAAETVAPLVGGMIETVTLQQTNEWGEPRGKSVSFREYLVQRADAYLREPVDYEGKTQAEGRGYGSWKKAQERVAHMIDRHLHYHIERAMKEALTTANSAIVEGIEATVKAKLAEVSKALTVELKKPR